MIHTPEKKILVTAGVADGLGKHVGQFDIP